ncbi:MAG TPA: TolC family protein [Candidatus Acidoferrales bacterium]
MIKAIAKTFRLFAALLVAISLAIAPVYAQPAGELQTPSGTQARQANNNNLLPPMPMSLSLAPDYSKGAPWFPNVAAPYMPRHIRQPVLTNSPRLAQLIQSGKLNLSLDDAISLALENNLDIAVQRYTPWLDQMNLLLARSGANGRLAFDPTATASINATDQTIPIANPLFSGIGLSTTNIASSIQTHTSNFNFSYTQGFAPGTQAQVTFDNSRSSSPSSFNLFNPALQSTLAVTLTQPLLNGFGYVPNERYIIEAKNTVRVGEWQFKLAAINDVTTTATDYWNLVYARQNVTVEQQTVSVDQQLYNDNKDKLRIGTMSPLDVLTAQSQLASDQQQLVVAQTLQLEDETKLLTDITKDPFDSILQNVEVVPTTPISTSDTVGNPTIQQLVQQAWQNRPELQEQALNLKNAGVEVQATRNSLLPSLNLVGEYSTTGLGGNKLAETVTTPTIPVANSADPILNNGVAIPNEFVGAFPQTVATSAVPGGINDAWDSLIRSRFPTFQVGMTLNLPIRNRAAQAANGTALLNQRQQTVSYQEEKNTIYLAVRNALIAVTQDRSAVAAAATARQLAQETFTDEQEKYRLGGSTSYNVVLRSRDLTAAETTELQDQINLVEAVLALDQAMGRTLEAHNISIEDARSAKVTTIPNIPGTPNQ